MHPKRPNPKIPKNRKKCIFLKKSTFSKWAAGHRRWSKMVPTDPSKCSKHISSQYLEFISILDHFLKNRKKSIFEIFFGSCINKIGRISIFRPKIGPKSFGIEKTYQCPFQKKIFQIRMGFSDFYSKKCLHRLIWPKTNFLHLCSFGYKKA